VRDISSGSTVSNDQQATVRTHRVATVFENRQALRFGPSRE
jgi:hypothetical protein